MEKGKIELRNCFLNVERTQGRKGRRKRKSLRRLKLLIEEGKVVELPPTIEERIKKGIII